MSDYEDPAQTPSSGDAQQHDFSGAIDSPSGMQPDEPAASMPTRPIPPITVPEVPTVSTANTDWAADGAPTAAMPAAQPTDTYMPYDAQPTQVFAPAGVYDYQAQQPGGDRNQGAQPGQPGQYDPYAGQSEPYGQPNQYDRPDQYGQPEYGQYTQQQPAPERQPGGGYQQYPYGQAPGYGSPAGYAVPPQGAYPYSNPAGSWNVLTIIGFVFAFFNPMLGLIFSIIGLVMVRKSGQKSRGLAIAGIVISAATVVLAIVLAVSAVSALKSMTSDSTSFSSPSGSSSLGQCTGSGCDYLREYGLDGNDADGWSDDSLYGYGSDSGDGYGDTGDYSDLQNSDGVSYLDVTMARQPVLIC